MTEKLDARVNLRVTAAEKELLKEDAELTGLSVSELVRRQYFRMQIKAKTDLLMINELRRIGGLLKHTLNVSQGQHPEQTLQAIQEVRMAVQRIAKDGK